MVKHPLNLRLKINAMNVLWGSGHDIYLCLNLILKILRASQTKQLQQIIQSIFKGKALGFLLLIQDSAKNLYKQQQNNGIRYSRWDLHHFLVHAHFSSFSTTISVGIIFKLFGGHVLCQTREPFLSRAHHLGWLQLLVPFPQEMLHIQSSSHNRRVTTNSCFEPHAAQGRLSPPAPSQHSLLSSHTTASPCSIPPSARC